VIALLVRAAAVVGWLHRRPPAERPQPTDREARHMLRPARVRDPRGGPHRARRLPVGRAAQATAISPTIRKPACRWRKSQLRQGFPW